MIPLRNLIADKSTRISIKASPQVIEIGLVIQKSVRKFLDEDPDKITISSFNNGTLILKTKSPYATHKLYSEKKELINSINSSLGGEVVKKILFKPS